MTNNSAPPKREDCHLESVICNLRLRAVPLVPRNWGPGIENRAHPPRLDGKLAPGEPEAKRTGNPGNEFKMDQGVIVDGKIGPSPHKIMMCHF